jgi:hypothetical protein
MEILNWPFKWRYYEHIDTGLLKFKQSQIMELLQHTDFA